MYPDLEKQYGAYEMPPEIKDLFNLEDALGKKLSLDMISFRPIHDDYQYAITPFDVIPFADTGGNGIHFGFLTEFGQVANLQEAQIVCVSPTNDPPIRLMARNIKEFFSLATSIPSVPYVELLESFCLYDHHQIIEVLKEYESDIGRRGLAKRKKVLDRVKETFQTKEMDIVAYFREVREERNAKKVMETLDGLGIIGEKEEGVNYRSFSFQHPLTEEHVKEMQQFLAEANRIEILAFLRDVNYSYVVTPGFDEPVLQIVNEQLTKLQLLDEIERLKMR